MTTTNAPAPPSVTVIRRALAEFKLPAYDDQVLQIQQYIKILLAWNEKINLTAIRDPLEILYRHFCESMYAAEIIPERGGRLADVGSGGGFPNDAQVLVRRYEELHEEIAPLDYVCSRALGEFPAFLSWAASDQIGAKQAILWIGARDLPEIESISGWDWREPIQVPHSLRRLLLVGAKKPLAVSGQSSADQA